MVNLVAIILAMGISILAKAQSILNCNFQILTLVAAVLLLAYPYEVCSQGCEVCVGAQSSRICCERCDIGCGKIERYYKKRSQSCGNCHSEGDCCERCGANCGKC